MSHGALSTAVCPKYRLHHLDFVLFVWKVLPLSLSVCTVLSRENLIILDKTALRVRAPRHSTRQMNAIGQAFTGCRGGAVIMSSDSAPQGLSVSVYVTGEENRHLCPNVFITSVMRSEARLPKML